MLAWVFVLESGFSRISLGLLIILGGVFGILVWEISDSWRLSSIRRPNSFYKFFFSQSIAYTWVEDIVSCVGWIGAGWERDHKTLVLAKELLSNTLSFSSGERGNGQIMAQVSKVDDLSRGWPEGSLFNIYNTKVLGRVLLYLLPGLLHFTLDPYFIMLSVKQGDHFF